MTIAQVCEKYDLTADTLRYYEKIGLIPPVQRTSGGIRNYDEDSCKWVELMKCMRLSGVQINALVKYVALFREGDKTLVQRQNILIEQKEILCKKIEEMKTTLARLDYKINNYDMIIANQKTT